MIFFGILPYILFLSAKILEELQNTKFKLFNLIGYLEETDCIFFIVEESSTDLRTSNINRNEADRQLDS